MKRICEYCDAPTEADWFSDLNEKPPKKWPQQGDVDFIDYSTNYRPEQNLVLKNITFGVRPREKVI